MTAQTKPISQAEAEKEFAYVRRTFFRQWKRGEMWQVKVVPDLGDAIGQCDRGAKTVLLLDDIAPLSLWCLLIHEVAHGSVTSGICGDSHGFGWQKRMEGAARKAERLGLTELATEIRENRRWNRLNNEDDYGRRLWYNELRSVADRQPGASFTEIFSGSELRHIMSEQEFLEDYPETRDIYDNTA